jgi:hypothetical protein
MNALRRVFRKIGAAIAQNIRNGYETPDEW